MKNKLISWYKKLRFLMYKGFWNKKTYLGYNLPLMSDDFTNLTSRYSELKWFKVSDVLEKVKIWLILNKSKKFQHVMLDFLGDHYKKQNFNYTIPHVGYLDVSGWNK